MLNEGWDANNVTHILGLRAFESQLLCEQVVGRGLRRMDYTPDPETGRLTEEYVDVYGIPFSVIPYKGRPKGRRTPEDKPKNHVRAIPERKHLEMRFPIVEGYTFDLKRNIITADVPGMETLRIEPASEPTAVFVKPRVGYEHGKPTLFGPGDFEAQDPRGILRKLSHTADPVPDSAARGRRASRVHRHRRGSEWTALGFRHHATSCFRRCTGTWPSTSKPRWTSPE